MSQQPLTAVPVLEPKQRNPLRRRLFLALTGEYFWFYVMLVPSLLILVAVVIIPMLYALRMSLANSSVVVIGGRGMVTGQWVGLQNYASLMQNPLFWQAFRETLYFWLVSIVIEVTVGIGMAVLLNQNFWGRKVVRVIVFIPWAIPTVVNAMLWGMILDGDNYGALNDLLLRLHLISAPIVWLNPTPLFSQIPWLANALSFVGANSAMNALIVGDEWKTLPIVAVLILAGLQTIPGEYYEAARVEGATGWRQFRQITLPLLGPILTVVLILRTMQLLRAFTLIFTLEQYGMPLLSIQAYQQAFSFGSFGTGSAISFLIALLALLIAIVYIKRLYREEL
ncbi:MAG: carbohydrate ABC transporter permease [Bacilli bacterium]